MIITSRGAGYSGASPLDNQLFIRRSDVRLDGTHPAVLCCHGHGGDSGQFQPFGKTGSSPGWHAWNLAMAGYLVLAVDHGAAPHAEWSNQSAMDRLTDAYNYAMAQGAKPGKVGLFGWSMGGLTALNWIKRNPTLAACAWLWAAVTDLDWARLNSSWGPEITTDYPSGSAGFNVHDEPTSWRGVCPITFAHADDDSVVPPSLTDTFVSAVADPKVKKRSVPTGNHTALFTQVPSAETIAFFKANL